VDARQHHRPAGRAGWHRPTPLARPKANWHDVANEMEIEDGVIWVYAAGEDGVMAFTDFGIENLIELIKCTRRSRPAQALASARMTNWRPTPDAYDVDSHGRDIAHPRSFAASALRVRRLFHRPCQ